MRRKQNFEGLKVTQQSWLLLFAFSPPFFFRFSSLIFFSLAGHLVGLILVGRVFRKAFRILGLGERKGRWVMEQDFHGDFQVDVTWFFACFSGVLDWIVLILVWFERSLHSAQVLLKEIREAYKRKVQGENWQYEHCISTTFLLKCSAIGIGFNGAQTNCGIARILGILLMNSWDTYIYF